MDKFFTEFYKCSGFFENATSFLAAWDNFLTNYPSGISSLDEGLKKGSARFTNTHNMGRWYKYNSYSIQNLRMAILELDDYVLYELLEMTPADVQLLSKSSAYEAFNLDWYIRTKHYDWLSDPAIAKLEINISNVEESFIDNDEFRRLIILRWGDGNEQTAKERMNMLFEQLHQTDMEGFLAKLSNAKYTTFEDQCTCLYTGLRQHIGVYYVDRTNAQNRYKSQFSVGDRIIESSLPALFETTAPEDVLWNFKTFLAYANFNTDVAKHFTEQTGLSCNPHIINDNNNWKINQYLADNKYNLKDKPISETLCENVTTDFLMCENDSSKIAHSHYVACEQLTAKRDFSLLLLLADIAVTNRKYNLIHSAAFIKH